MMPPGAYTQMPGLPGLESISQMMTEDGPMDIGNEQGGAMGLTIYPQHDDQSKALQRAVRASRTDMPRATPPQRYIEDTRNNKWTITQSNASFSPTGNIVANLASGQFVDLQTTRVAGILSFTIPAATTAPAATDVLTIHPMAPLMAMTTGVQLGNNSNVVQDVGTSLDQPWLIAMQAAYEQFDTTRFIMDAYAVAQVGGVATPVNALWGGSNEYYNPRSQAATVFTTTTNNFFPTIQPSTTGETTVYVNFVIRPAHPYFNIEKAWSPTLPLRLTLRWNSEMLNGVFLGSGQAANTTAQLYIQTVRCEELWFTNEMKNHALKNFQTGQGINMNRTAMANTAQTSATLYDPSYGVASLNPQAVAAIYQYTSSRLSRHSISGNQFSFHPVLNGSARPKFMVIAIPNNIMNTFATLTPGNAAWLAQLQILYNGLTVWDEPYLTSSYSTPAAIDGLSALPLYSESKRYAAADQQLRPRWWDYVRWADSACFIVVMLSASHNRDEIQPNMAAPVEVQGRFNVAPPTNTTILVGLFFDQTLICLRDNSTIQSLPIMS